MDTPVHRAVPQLMDPGSSLGTSHQGSSGSRASVRVDPKQPGPGEAPVLFLVPPEAFDLALSAEHVLGILRAHRVHMMNGIDWTERDRVSIDALGRSITAFWSRDTSGER